MAEHTPPPWEWVGNGWLQHPGAEVAVIRIEQWFGSFRESHDSYARQHRPRWLADRALLRAAPDLYAAAEAQQEADEHRRECELCRRSRPCDLLGILSNRAHELREAALARAKGD